MKVGAAETRRTKRIVIRRYDVRLCYSERVLDERYPEVELEQQFAKAARISLESPRRSSSHQLPHHQPQIERSDMDQQSLADVRAASQMDTAHPARVVCVREASFQ